MIAIERKNTVAYAKVCGKNVKVYQKKIEGTTHTSFYFYVNDRLVQILGDSPESTPWHQVFGRYCGELAMDHYYKAL